ncbi:hypothetical protein EG68_06756 [Paragonimus skrjabini miyazakii]|uniref:FYVE-type domain-containing protein n=1 Tax=Paragonimus skrjabini miyazakii TaxID=59628 RepID=A0A8S9YRM8_9TREM|nr:hypothetical protein EG68_06756 [Paragonimus skrjabini miyazakii]
MQKDVLVDFYLETVKTQSYELHLCKQDVPEEVYPTLLRDTENARRELGKATCLLLNSALPSHVRKSRLFRIKYVEEVDIQNLERCLIAAANKVVAFNPPSSPRDIDLRPAQPSASLFLDVLSQVQSIVSCLIEVALAATDRADLAKLEQTDVNWCPAVATDSPVSPVEVDQSQSETDIQPVYSMVLMPVVLRERANAELDSSSRTATSSPSIPSIHQTSTSYSTMSEPKEGCTSVQFVVKVGSRVHHETVRLPPLTALCFTQELFGKLCELDDAAADFEYEFVRSLSRRLRTKQEAEDLQLVAVLFSETLMWGLGVRLFTMQQLADRDPSVLLSLPRLAILVGTRLLPDSPIGANRLASGQRLPAIFATFRSNLAYLARQLHALRTDQLCRLARWLGPRGLPNLISSQSRKLNTPGPCCDTMTSSPLPIKPLISSAQSESVLIDSGSTEARSNSPQGLNSSWSGVPTSRPCVKWQTNLLGLHLLFKRISALSEEVSTKFPTELRFVLQTSIEMHDSSNEDAALAQMDGLEADIEGSADDGQSDETESENELHVREDVVDKYLSSLAQLLDWYGVVGKRTIAKGLVDALNQSYSCLDEEKELCALSESSGHHQFLEKCQTAQEKSSLELGLDVAAMCEPRSKSSETGNTDEVIRSSQECLSRVGKTLSSELSDPAGLNQRLLKLNLGLPLQGTQTRDDRMWHYLPAWQPDRLPAEVTAVDKSGGTTSGTDSDAESEPNSDADSSVVFVVGRRCASCLHAFTLFRRRHHCRRCGHIFCASCCNHWQTVEGLATPTPVRICKECNQFLNPTNG